MNGLEHLQTGLHTRGNADCNDCLNDFQPSVDLTFKIRRRIKRKKYDKAKEEDKKYHVISDDHNATISRY